MARLSLKHWTEAAAALERAGRLRLRAEELVEADVHAYRGFVAARREARLLPEASREAALAPAFELTVTTPLAIVQVAVATVEQAAELAELGNPNLRADAVTAALLATAAGDAAAGLVAINLSRRPADARVAETRRLALLAKRLAERLAGSSAANAD